MSLFSAINTSGTGVDAMQTWIDVSAGNIANADDTSSPSSANYAVQTAEFSPESADANGIGEGVAVTVAEGTTSGELVPGEGSPLADSDGEVSQAAVPLSDQMVDLMQAQEGYQANTAAISRAISAYQSGLTIGT